MHPPQQQAVTEAAVVGYCLTLLQHPALKQTCKIITILHCYFLMIIHPKIPKLRFTRKVFQTKIE